VEKDGGVVDGPAYTEVKVRNGDHLRIGDLLDFDFFRSPCIHPFLEEGLIWWGSFYAHTDKDWNLKKFRDGVQMHSKIDRSQVAYATSIYRRDCDIVIFTLHCDRVRGKRHMPPFDDRNSFNQLYLLLRSLGMTLVPGQISIPMPLN
jgi:hypothetical protein